MNVGIANPRDSLDKILANLSLSLVKRGKWGVYDEKSNKYIVPCLYDDISFYDNKYIKVSVFNKERGCGLISGIVGFDGRFLVQPKYLEIWPSESGNFIVTDLGLQRCGSVNDDGLSDLEYESYESVYCDKYSCPDIRISETAFPSKPKYLVVSKYEKYGVIDLDNNQIVPIEYNSIKVINSSNLDFSTSYFFLVSKNGYFGYYGEKGDKIIVPSCDKETAKRLFREYLESIFLSQLRSERASTIDNTLKDDIKAKPIEKQIQSSQSNVEPDRDFYLFFDTETTGLPVDYNAPSSNLSNWPRMVQLSWIITDGSGKELRTGDYIIKPKGFTIPLTASSLNGITTERANKDGFDLEIVLSLFLADLNLSKVIVGHNIDFDKKIVGAELIRTGKEDIIASKKSICTMKESVSFCKLPGRYGFKYPTLQDLHFKLFGCSFDGAHDSANDVSATVKCFWKMKSLGVL